MVRKLGQITLLQLVKVDFQWFDVRGGLRGLLQVRDGLLGNFHLCGCVRLTILNTNSQKKYAKNAPNQLRNFSMMLLTKNQLFGSCAGSDLQAIYLVSNLGVQFFLSEQVQPKLSPPF
jgi:hypothetical protein